MSRAAKFKYVTEKNLKTNIVFIFYNKFQAMVHFWLVQREICKLYFSLISFLLWTIFNLSLENMKLSKL